MTAVTSLTRPIAKGWVTVFLRIQTWTYRNQNMYDEQVKMVPTYQKFIVPPPLATDNMTKVKKESLLKISLLSFALGFLSLLLSRFITLDVSYT